LREHTNTYAHI